MSKISVKTIIYIDGVEKDFQGQYLPDTEGGMFTKSYIFVDDENEAQEIMYQTQWQTRSLNPSPQLSQRLNQTVSQDKRSQNASGDPKRKANT